MNKLRAYLKQMGFWDAAAGYAAGAMLVGLIILICTLATSCAPRFHPTKRPADTELRTTPH